MKTFSDLKVGDYIYIITTLDDVYRIYKYVIVRKIDKDFFEIKHDSWIHTTYVTLKMNENTDGCIFACVEAILKFIVERD